MDRHQLSIQSKAKDGGTVMIQQAPQTWTFRQFVKMVNERIISSETRYPAINFLYGAFACTMLLHHVYVTIYYSKIPTGAENFSVAWIVFATLTIILGQLWKDKAAWILLPLLLIRTFRIDPTEEAAAIIRNEVFFLSLYAYFGCYGAGRVFKQKDLKRFIAAFCCLWTVAMVVFSCFSIHVAWTGETIKTLGKGKFYVRVNRIQPVYHMVCGGLMASISIAAAFVGINLTKRRWVKALYIPALIVVFIGGAVTVTRTGYILNGLAVSILLTLYLSKKIHWFKGRKRILRGFLLFICFTTVMAILLAAQMRFIQLFNTVKAERQSLVINSAVAETKETEEKADSVALQPRDLVLDQGLDGFLTGRLEIWKNAVAVIQEDPSVLLWGNSAYKPVTSLKQYRASHGLFKVYHTHNFMLQMIFENGLPALIMLLGFYLVFIIRMVKVMRNRSLPLWARYVPVPAMLCLTAELIDILCSTSKGFPPMTILYVFIGLTAALHEQEKKASKNKMAQELLQ